MYSISYFLYFILLVHSLCAQLSDLEMAMPKKSKSKTKTKRRDIYYALKALEEETNTSYLYVVGKLKKEDAEKWEDLSSSTLQTWHNRYAAGPEREKLLLNNPDGYRARADKYERMKVALRDEVSRREKKNLMRDRETMMDWMEGKAKQFVNDGDIKYKNFKNSIGFFYDSVKDKNISMDKVKGASDKPWSGYVVKRREWIEGERAWLNDHGFVHNGRIDMDRVDAVDEVPVTLKGKARKQCNSSDDRQCKVVDVAVTFDTSKRFATINPITGYSRVNGVYINMKGSPRPREIKLYPSGIGWNPDKKGWMNKTGWLGLSRYYKKCTRSLRALGQRACYYDHYGVHKKYKTDFESLSGHHGRLFIVAETGNGQSIDQGIGLFYQNFYHRKYYLLQRAYSNKIDQGLNPKKFGLGDMRIKLMKWTEEATTEINKRPNFIRSCWKNTMLAAPCDGTEDIFYEIAPKHVTAKRRVLNGLDKDTILISGYLRHSSKIYALFIPSVIAQVVLVFCDVDILSIGADIANYKPDGDYQVIGYDDNPVMAEIVGDEMLDFSHLE